MSKRDLTDMSSGALAKHCNLRAACISTKASPPVAPEPPYVAVPAAANSLQLEWPEPWGCGAPVSGYAVEMAPADAVLTVQGPPTPPQVSAVPRASWQSDASAHAFPESCCPTGPIPHDDSIRQLVLDAIIRGAAARKRLREPDDVAPLRQITSNCRKKAHVCTLFFTP